MARWVGTRGYEVEVIVLNDRQVYRVSHRVEDRLYLLAYTRSVREVARHVDLSTLVEVVELRR